MNASNATSFERQYEALRSGYAVVELTGWSSTSVAGADRQAFLHNFCTNDVKQLKPGESCEAFFTNVKGKIIGHGVISCRENEFVILGAPGQAPRLIEHLDRYVIREDVKLSDSTRERSYLLVGRDVNDPNSSITWNILGTAAERIVELKTSDARESVAKLCNEKCIVASDAFNAARIEAGFPLFGIDFDEDNFPQEIGRDMQAINFNKGCYLGQETVARIDALGHVNQRLVGVRFFGSEIPPAGTEVSRDNTKVGSLTSAIYSPLLQVPLALAMVRREANSPGSQLESSAGRCEVVTLPLATTM
jgi:tRNA-modifying protein YgfZ